MNDRATRKACLLDRRASASIVWFLSIACVMGGDASAQFLKLGPFDVDMAAGLDAVYSSNVDGVRRSESTQEMSDYYLVGRLSLKANADLTKNIRVGSGFEIVEEKHFRRSDLDDRTRSDPFGRIDLNTDMEFGRYVLYLFYKHESTYERKEGQVIEGARAKRAYRRSDDYGARVGWERSRVRFSGGMTAGRDRYVDEEFQDGDEDRAEANLGASWQMNRRILSFANYNRSRTKLVNDPDSFDGWDEAYKAGASFLLITRPNTTYAFAMNKQTSQGEDLGWEPSHTFTVRDALDLGRTLTLSGDASYEIKKNRGVNEIALTYGATLDHDIARTARQSLKATREPADTFGSTVDTDSTTIGYGFQKQDLFIYDLAFSAGVTYRIDRPLGEVDQEDERTWNYVAGLAWSRRISRKLQRTVRYDYSLEKSDQIDDDLSEHRVTVNYAYKF